MASYIVQTALLFREAKCLELMSSFWQVRLQTLIRKKLGQKAPAKMLRC